MSDAIAAGIIDAFGGLCSAAVIASSLIIVLRRWVCSGLNGFVGEATILKFGTITRSDVLALDAAFADWRILAAVYHSRCSARSWMAEVNDSTARMRDATRLNS